MGRYPRSARNAQLKCIECNAPVVETVGNGYACVACGESPITPRQSRPDRPSASRRTQSVSDD